jgi:hypothetical protein
MPLAHPVFEAQAQPVSGVHTRPARQLAHDFSLKRRLVDAPITTIAPIAIGNSSGNAVNISTASPSISCGDFLPRAYSSSSLLFLL